MPSYGNYSSSPFSSASPTHNSSFSSPSRPQNKRKQVKNACTNCQKACKKCDDQRPCTRCVKYGIEDSCVNSQRKERKRKDSSYSASESASELSSPLPKMSRSGREIRKAQRQLEAVRSTSRSIRSFSKELLQSLQDEEDFEEQQSNNQANNCLEVLQITQDFKELAQLCSDLHVKIHQASQQVIQMTPFTYPSPTYAQQTYPMPTAFMYCSTPPAQPILELPVISNIPIYKPPLDHRVLMNRTPPEDLPSPVKSEDGNAKFFDPEASF